MGTPIPPIQIPLTEEQQALIQRLSGQHVQVLELTAGSNRWRDRGGTRAQLSVAVVGGDGHPAPGVELR